VDLHLFVLFMPSWRGQGKPNFIIIIIIIIITITISSSSSSSGEQQRKVYIG